MTTHPPHALRLFPAHHVPRFLDEPFVACDNIRMSEQERTYGIGAQVGASDDVAGAADEDNVARAHGMEYEPPAPTILRDIIMPRSDWSRLRRLPWGAPLEEWGTLGVTTLNIRRGESRHVVIFVEVGRHRYAIKETSPVTARKEISVLEELQRRHCHTLEPVGSLTVRGEPIPIGEVAGRIAYMSGDTGYCITRLAERVLPQSLLYRYPFTPENKRLLWNAVAELLLDLHEAGVYWGDPSLANVLMDLSDHRLTAVMADAETAEVIVGKLDEGLRQQDVHSFMESLEWQAEDIRIARGLEEEQQLVTESDAAYFLSRYNGLRAEREASRQETGTLFSRLMDIERRIQRLNALGYGVLSMSARALRSSLATIDMTATAGATNADNGLLVATLRPAWYMHRMRELLGVRIPRNYARRIFLHINAHKWLLSEREGRDVGMDFAVRDWILHVHEPLLAFLHTLMPHADADTLYSAYADILDHVWDMSQVEHRPVPLEEGAMDYALAQARPTAPTVNENLEK